MTSYPNHRTDHVINYFNVDQKMSYLEMLRDLEYLVSVIRPKLDEEIQKEAKERGWSWPKRRNRKVEDPTHVNFF